MTCPEFIKSVHRYKVYSIQSKKGIHEYILHVYTAGGGEGYMHPARPHCRPVEKDTPYITILLAV
jgi:hypothetical protein